MYSPQIRDDLIPRVYHAAKACGVAMTTWVNRAIEAALAGFEDTGGEGRQTTLSKDPANSNHATRQGGKQP